MPVTLCNDQDTEVDARDELLEVLRDLVDLRLGWVDVDGGLFVGRCHKIINSKLTQ